MGHIIDLYDYANANRQLRKAAKEGWKPGPLLEAFEFVGNLIFIVIPAIIIFGGLIWFFGTIIGWAKILGFIGFCVFGGILSAIGGK